MAEPITIRGIWAGMSDETAATVLADIRRESADMYRGALSTAAGTLRMRPQVLRQQPVPRQAASIRRVLTRVDQQELGAHLLIEWLTKTQKPMLTQFLDDLGIEHDDGTVKEEIGPEPEAAKLGAAVERLRTGFPPDLVRVYLSAFSAITAGGWERLPALIETGEGA